MRLLDLLVVGGTPVPDAVEAEWVSAVLKQAEALVVCQDFLEADAAFSVAIEFVLLWFWRHGLWMHVVAVLAVAAIALQVELANDPVAVVREEVVDNLIVIFQVVWNALLVCHLASGAYFQHFANLARVIQVRKKDDLFVVALDHLIVVLDLHSLLGRLKLLRQILEHVKVVLAQLSRDHGVRR